MAGVGDASDRETDALLQEMARLQAELEQATRDQVFRQ